MINTLTTSLEEVRKPIEPDNVIRILKSQYDRHKTLSISQEEQGFMGTSLKKVHTCTSCKKQGHSIEVCWAKGGGKEGQGLRQKKSKSKKKKGKAKVNAAEEESSDGKSDGSITFINFDCATLIKNILGATVILDMGASLHITPHQDMLKNYKSFSKPRII